jgi:hypothetical protein
MSEAVMHIESKGKMTKSEAIRQAMEILGNDAPSKDIQAHAIKISGGEVDIRTVYQMKSNIRADKSSEKKAVKVVKAEKPAAKKAVRQAKKQIAPISSDAGVFFAKLGEIKSLVNFFGSKAGLLEAIEQVA